MYARECSNTAADNAGPSQTWSFHSYWTRVGLNVGLDRLLRWRDKYIPDTDVVGHRLALQWLMVMEPGHPFLREVLLATSNAIRKLALLEQGTLILGARNSLMESHAMSHKGSVEFTHICTAARLLAHTAYLFVICRVGPF
eukprot:m.250428 g.250428  ORF g.250428 m.250428 type:complete len:141 (-) comp19529_c1_seq58:1686-2108(-)